MFAQITALKMHSDAIRVFEGAHIVLVSEACRGLGHPKPIGFPDPAAASFSV